MVYFISMKSSIAHSFSKHSEDTDQIPYSAESYDTLIWVCMVCLCSTRVLDSHRKYYCHLLPFRIKQLIFKYLQLLFGLLKTDQFVWMRSLVCAFVVHIH